MDCSDAVDQYLIRLKEEINYNDNTLRIIDGSIGVKSGESSMNTTTEAGGKENPLADNINDTDIDSQNNFTPGKNTVRLRENPDDDSDISSSIQNLVNMYDHLNHGKSYSSMENDVVNEEDTDSEICEDSHHINQHEDIEEHHYDRNIDDANKYKDSQADVISDRDDIDEITWTDIGNPSTSTILKRRYSSRKGNQDSFNSHDKTLLKAILLLLMVLLIGMTVLSVTLYRIHEGLQETRGTANKAVEETVNEKALISDLEKARKFFNITFDAKDKALVKTIKSIRDNLLVIVDRQKRQDALISNFTSKLQAQSSAVKTIRTHTDNQDFKTGQLKIELNAQRKEMTSIESLVNSLKSLITDLKLKIHWQKSTMNTMQIDQNSQLARIKDNKREIQDNKAENKRQKGAISKQDAAINNMIAEIKHFRLSQAGILKSLQEQKSAIEYLKTRENNQNITRVLTNLKEQNATIEDLKTRLNNQNILLSDLKKDQVDLQKNQHIQIGTLTKLKTGQVDLQMNQHTQNGTLTKLRTGQVDLQKNQHIQNGTLTKLMKNQHIQNGTLTKLKTCQVDLQKNQHIQNGTLIKLKIGQEYLKINQSNLQTNQDHQNASLFTIQRRQDKQNMSIAVIQIDQKQQTSLVTQIQMRLSNLQNSVEYKPGTEKNPGKTCQTIRDEVAKQNQQAAKSLQNGLYWVMLSKPTQMFCDMELGGWTKVGNAKLPGSTNHGPDLFWKEHLSNNVTLLKNVENGTFLLGDVGLRELQNYTSFTQLRWKCKKSSHNRTFHIHTANTTLGRKVVDYMLGRISYAARPTACHSYVRLADDTSHLSRKCSLWMDGKYGYHGGSSKKGDCCAGGRFYGAPMLSDAKNSEKGVMLFGNHDLMLCDDIYTDPNFSTDGQWEFFVK